MKSMTGYGTFKDQGSAVSLEVSLKAVNGRYFDLRTHLPKEYVHLESHLKKVILKKVQRGTVDLYISRQISEKNLNIQIKKNTLKAKKWVKTIKELAEDLKLEPEFNLLNLIDMGDLVEEVKDVTVSDAEEKKLLNVLKETVILCDSERDREGQSLKSELQGLLKKLLSLTEQMEKLRDKANKELQIKVKKRLEAFDLNKKEWEPRWAMEISQMADRSDINEEVVRLKEHIGSILKIIEGKGPHGKKLDFYCQELLRETNTIGSKSNIARLTHMVVEAKSVVEKLREQVQNVE